MPRDKVTDKQNKSRARALADHVFEYQKERIKMGLFIRTIGKVRVETKTCLANMAYNLQRLVFHECRKALG